MRIVVNEWPDSQECIDCNHAIFIPEGSSKYSCDVNCVASSQECKENRKEATKEEWDSKFV